MIFSCCTSNNYSYCKLQFNNIRRKRLQETFGFKKPFVRLLYKSDFLLIMVFVIVQLPKKPYHCSLTNESIFVH